MIISYGMAGLQYMGMDCSDWIKAIAYSRLKALKEELESIRRRYSKMYQIRHRRSEFLKQLLDRWTDIAVPSPAPT